MSCEHPFDFSNFKKGSWIETNELEFRFGHRAETREFNLLKLQLRGEIESQLGIICKEERNRIRLMTDVEADNYRLTQTQHAVSSLRRQHQRASLIDRSSMTAEESRKADSRDRIIGVTYAAARAAWSKSREFLSLLHGKPKAEQPRSLEEEG
jgi:hypothetical protein